ncbi:MAG: hypothetical protein M1838_002114 [Thelocarpon superellum]|nr:MAG: hypothetical protein M1838_002114 [Thelocarpon superellum]
MLSQGPVRHAARSSDEATFAMAVPSRALCGGNCEPVPVEIRQEKHLIKSTVEIIAPSISSETGADGDDIVPHVGERVERKGSTSGGHSIRHDPDRTPPARRSIRLETARDIATHVLDVTDDPTRNPWTFRLWFLGIGLGSFGSVLATIFFFKPQVVSVSVIFLAVVSHVMGNAMAQMLPRTGWSGRWLNPHPFHRKEHVAIIIMASSAATCAYGIEALAVRQLWYASSPNAAESILLLFSSQLLGYGIGGLLRQTLVYPTRMLYPVVLPIMAMVDTLDGDRTMASVRPAASVRLRLFYAIFAVVFVWEAFPQYLMPIMTGLSVFCLTHRDDQTITNIFGGSNGNEGLGLLSLCLDWQYIARSMSPLWVPLPTLVNSCMGYVIGLVVLAAAFYGHLWRAQDFPFLSQLLFSPESNATRYVPYNQSAILGPTNEVNVSALDLDRLPYFSTAHVLYLITTNLAAMATVTHILLWHYDDLSSAWSCLASTPLDRLFRRWRWGRGAGRRAHAALDDEATRDPHFQLMRAYDEVPIWWYLVVLGLSILVGMVCLRQVESGLPWWGFLLAVAIAAVSIVFFGMQWAITGYSFGIQPVVQMIAGYCLVGKPVANMYFTLFAFNSASQGQILLKDLKLGQYAKLSPKCTFTAQFVGTIVGAILNYVMMNSIVSSQRVIFLSVEGTTVWSGQNVQQYNSQAIAWGAFARELFSIGGRYQWVTLAFLIGLALPFPAWFLHRRFPRAGLQHVNTAIISYNIGALSASINAANLSYYAVGFFSQFYLRRYQAAWFVRYNYLVSAAMDSGTEVLVFILTFAVQGASGSAVRFPRYWGNNRGGNSDYCALRAA